MVAARRRSKKPSAGNASPPPNDPLVFFIDECLGRNAVPDGLRSAGCIVERCCDHFKEGIDDVALLTALAPRAGKIVFLTKDGRIRRRALELRALKASGLRVFCLTSGNLPGAAQAAAFTGAVKRITRLASLHQGPFVARVTAGSDVEIIEWDIP